MGCAGSKEGESGGRTASPSSDGLEDKFHDPSDGPLSKKDIEKRVVSETGSFLLRKGDMTVRYACVSQRGYYPEDLYKANQDAYLITQNFDGQEGDLLLGVYDGHGQDGDHCSQFTTAHLGAELSAALKKGLKPPQALEEAYVETNRKLIAWDGCDASMSGTTAVTAFFHDGVLHVANAGDSRIVIGERRGNRVVAFPLSSDQTPHRKDERERCKECGAVVRTISMIYGEKDWSPAWEAALGTAAAEEEMEGDPPRLFTAGQGSPGCAFTRSIGDAEGESIGVYAVPELVTKQLREPDQFVVLASDGVWEFISSQEVVDDILRFTDPLEACRAVVAESYRRWLQYDVRTDDITIIVAWLDSTKHGAAPREAPPPEVTRFNALRDHGQRVSVADDEELFSVGLGLSFVGHSAESRPWRKTQSAELRKKMAAQQVDTQDEELDANWVPPRFEKTPEELRRIGNAVQANEFFDHLTAEQREQVYACMTKLPFSAKEVIIKQGDVGDWFYVLDSGELSVTIGTDNPLDAPEVLTYEPHPDGGANPCFGELALLYSCPRGANVVAKTEGVLWAIDRRTFKSLLMKRGGKADDKLAAAAAPPQKKPDVTA